MKVFSRIALIAVAIGSTSAAQPQGSSTVYTGGMWFDGDKFISRTMIVHDGRLEAARAVPTNATTVDLAGGYVIPPYCEGHNHDIAAGKAEERNRRYLNGGVFYVQILNNEPGAAHREKPFWDRADTVDVSFSHGGFTGVGGHPVEVLEGIRRSGGYGSNAVIADKAYYEVNSAADLERKWPLLRSERPDVVKLFLQFSEEIDKRRSDPAYFGNRGLSPTVFRQAVKLAKKDGFRVAAHVVSAADFRVAAEAGVDIIAHLPGYMSIETIRPEDAALAARNHSWVITTASLAKSYPNKNIDASALRAAQIANLRTLRDAGVQIAIGSDTWGDTSQREVEYLRSLRVFSDVEILRMWTQNCPRMIFPSRKVGNLEPGSEASFLVLDGNPLTDFAATRRVRTMVRNGVLLPKAPS